MLAEPGGENVFAKSCEERCLYDELWAQQVFGDK
jgi:hypothetical protein